MGLLSLAEFIYINSEYSTLSISPFYYIYGYNFKINFKLKDKFIKKEIPIVKDKVKSLYKIRLTLINK